MKTPKVRPILLIIAPYATATAEERIDTDDVVRRAIRLGWCPVFMPWQLERVLRESVPADRRAGLECSLSMARLCDEAVVVGDRITEGMRGELDELVSNPIKASRLKRPGSQYRPSDWLEWPPREAP